MSLAKLIDRDTDNSWPKNNEVDVYRALLRRVCFGVVSRRGSRGDVAQVKRSKTPVDGAMREILRQR